MIRQKWAVVIYERVTKKHDYHLSMQRANDKEKDCSSKKRAKKRRYATHFREHFRVQIKLPDRIIPRTLIRIPLKEPISVREGQYIGIVCHSNETLRFAEMDKYHRIRFLKNIFSHDDDYTREKRVDGNVRVYGAENIAAQNIYCVPCYRGERQSRANVQILEILGGFEFCLKESHKVMLRRYSDELAVSGSYKDVQKLLHTIITTFGSLEDMNPCSKVSFLHLVGRTSNSFEYRQGTNSESKIGSISIQDATLHWYLPDETDLEVVKYFFVYSASNIAVEKIARYNSEHNINLDPNNCMNSFLKLNFIACVGQGERDIDSEKPPSHYSLNLSSTTLPRGHDHIIIYAVRISCSPILLSNLVVRSSFLLYNHVSYDFLISFGSSLSYISSHLLDTRPKRNSASSSGRRPSGNSMGQCSQGASTPCTHSSFHARHTTSNVATVSMSFES